MFFDSLPPETEDTTPVASGGIICSGAATITGGAYVPSTEGGLIVAQFPLRHRRKVSVSSVPSALQDFVVPVKCRAGGDVAFFSTNGKRLPHEVRKHDHYMVRVDLETAGTEIYIYY